MNQNQLARRLPSSNLTQIAMAMDEAGFGVDPVKWREFVMASSHLPIPGINVPTISAHVIVSTGIEVSA